MIEKADLPGCKPEKSQYLTLKYILHQNIMKDILYFTTLYNVKQKAELEKSSFCKEFTKNFFTPVYWLNSICNV